MDGNVRSGIMGHVGKWLAFALLLGPVALMPCAPALAQVAAGDDRWVGDTSRNKAVVRDAFKRWAAGGTRFFDEVLAPDMSWTIVGSGQGSGTYRGRDLFKRDVIAPFGALLATPVRPVVENIWADGDHVIARWSGAATTRAGKPYRNDYVWIFRMRNGRADRVTAFLDLPAFQAVFRDR